MRPINFEGTNKVYTAPEGSENVQDLHVNFDVREDGTPSSISVWELEEDEVKAVVEGRGCVLLEILGGSHPVMGLRIVERED